MILGVGAELMPNILSAWTPRAGLFYNGRFAGPDASTSNGDGGASWMSEADFKLGRDK